MWDSLVSVKCVSLVVHKTQVGNPDTEQTRLLVLKLGDWAKLSHFSVGVLSFFHFRRWARQCSVKDVTESHFLDVPRN